VNDPSGPTDSSLNGRGGAIALPQALAQDMFEHALRGLPAEACGIVAGDRSPFEGGAALRFYPMKNAEQSPYRYRIDPEEQLRVMLEIDDRDEVVWAIFHSHTGSPAEPSPTDRRLAFYPGAVYLIASLRDPHQPEIRGWTIGDDTVREVDLDVR
jgi:proteasome lid subunit RPN8/RPN11